MKVTTKFVKDLQMADSEKLVESLYHQELQRSIQSMNGKVKSIKTAFKTDGVLDAVIGVNGEVKYLRLLLEAKYNENFENKVIRAKVLCQVVSYLKKFDGEGESLPSVILVGDKNECFVVHTNLLMKYLIGEYSWDLAPSVAYKDDKLLLDLTEDAELQKACFVFEINDDFSFDDVMKKAIDLFMNVKVKVQITDRSISKVFDYFTLRILKKNSDGTAKYSAREQRDFFMSLVMDTESCYLHPKKKNKAVFKDVEAEVNCDAFASFVDHYMFEYNIDEKKRFSEICDRLIEDADRRMKGDFYTPTQWVDEAHKMISEHLGADWRQEYMVFDCACGTKNLTRDYKFFELYSSTIDASDLKISEDYNKEGIAFQYDFLNDDVELFDELLKRVQQGEFLTINDFKDSKLYKYAPSLVQGLLNGKKLLFLINPPYASSKNGGKQKGNSKENFGTSKIKAIMSRNKVNGEVTNLYAEFLYRIKLIKNLFGSDINISLFSPALFLSGASYEKFRLDFLDDFMYQEGLLFCADNFDSVSSDWGILLSFFKSGKTINKQEFFCKIVEEKNMSIVNIGHKKLYNVANKCSDYVRKTTKHIKQYIESPYFSSAINTKQVGYGKMMKGSMGNFYSNSNNIYQNNQGVSLFSGAFTGFNSINIFDFNYSILMSLFTARRLIAGKYANWMNWEDEYMIPNVQHPKYQQWENDSIIYSLFNVKSNQSSLRSIQYNQKNWDIINHFFFMSEQEMKDLAQGKQDRATVNNNVENDIINHGGDRFVYEKIKQIESVQGFSDDAQAVLDKARELVEKSFKYRKLFAQTNAEYQIENWDAGWYQVKALLKEYMEDELKVFNQLYKAFENRMRPLVYELGFLYE